MFNIYSDCKSFISCDQPQTVKFVCLLIRERWGLDGAFLVIYPLLTEMRILIDVYVKAIVSPSWTRVK